MRKSTNGFTLIELMIVVVVIAILAIITRMAYVSYQNQAIASSGETMAKQVIQGAEQYYRNNAEYPTARSLAGGGDGRTMTDFTAAAQTLGLQSGDLLKNTDYTFTPCSGATTGTYCTANTTDTDRLFYFAREAGQTAAQTFNFNGPSPACSFTFSATSDPAYNGPSAFVVGYFNPQTKKWTLTKSTGGTVVNNQSAACPFS